MEGEAAANASGVHHADALIAFADALVGGDDSALGKARGRLLQAVGACALVDAAAVVANFERMVRIADATGIPLDAPLSILAGELGKELGLLRYGSAANTPAPGSVARLLGALFRPLAHGTLRLARLMGSARGGSEPLE